MDAPPVVLQLRGLTKRFGSLVANEAIDLDLRRGEVLALLGENGAGKSTLVGTVFGQYRADAGTIAVADASGSLQPLRPGSPRAALLAGIGLVHQHLALVPNLSVLDNIRLGTAALWRPWVDQRTARQKLLQVAADAGLAVDPDARVATLSVGEQQRVEILRSLYRGARILVLDEPTAVLSPIESERLFTSLRRLAASGMAMVLISHRLAEVMTWADRVAVLLRGRKVAERPIAGTSPDELAELMVGGRIEPPQHTPSQPGPPRLTLRRVSTRPTAEAPLGLQDVDLVVRSHEIVGVAGIAGNGQAALAGLVAGLIDLAAGQIELDGARWPAPPPGNLTAAGISRIPEDRHAEGVVGELDIAANLMLENPWDRSFQRGGLLRVGRIRRHADRLIKRFDVRAPGPGTAVRHLSGGNMQKVILARALDRGPRFLLAHQPGRGLDVGAAAFVHAQLLAARAAGAAILLLSEDLDELLALADRIAVLHRGRLGPALPAAGLDTRRIGLMMSGMAVDAPRAA